MLTFLNIFSHFIANTLKYFQERSLGDIYEKMSFCLFVFLSFLVSCSRHDFSHYYIPARVYIYYNNNYILYNNISYSAVRRVKRQKDRSNSLN